MRKIFTLLLLLIPLWVQAQDDDIWDEESKTLTVTLGETTEYSSYKDQAEHLVIKVGTSTEIPADAFRYDWKKVEDIRIESGVTTIGNFAFADCTAKTVSIPESVESIGEGAFYACSSLTDVTIPGSVESIGKQAFIYCTALEKVIIKEGVENIETGAFYSCTALTEVAISGSVESIGNIAFQDCVSLTEITIPGRVESFGQQVFQGCIALEKVTIEEGVKSIGVYAFYNCTSLTEIAIPESVTDILENAFEGCTSLKEITIPSSVASIKGYAFQNCSALTNIVYEGTRPLTVGSYAFLGISADATVTVPADYEGDSFGSFSGDNLKKELYAIMINATTNGSITATVDKEAAKYAKKDATVTLTVTPDDEYILGTLTVADKDGNPVTVTGNTFTMPASNVTISATFTEKSDEPEPEAPDTPVIPDMPEYYNIMVEECEGVTVETSTNVVREGTSMTFTIDVAEGYSAEDMTVKVKRSLFGTTDIIEPNDEGIYEIKNIYTDIYITVDGVEEEEEETPTGMEELEGVKVYSKDGSIYVQTPKQEQMQIISISGAVLKNETQVGLQRYDLPRGIYILCIGEQRFKVRN